MSPVQAGGGRGSDASGAGASGGKPKTPSAPKASGPSTAKKTGPGTQGKRPAGAGGGRSGASPSKSQGAKGKTGKTIEAPSPSRFSPSTMAFVAIGIVVLIVVVFVVVKVTGGGNTASSGAPSESAAPASLVDTVTNASNEVANKVGAPSNVAPPHVAKNQAVLMINGKPAVLFIGGLFCPYCAAERWGIVMALSPFGTWSGLRQTTSSPWDTDPSTATFGFNGSTFTSDLITFVSREAESNDTTGPGTRKPLEALTPQEKNLWSKYSSYFGLSGTGFPFLDIGNQYFVVTPSYDPAVLQGLDHGEIAAKLKDPSDPVAQAIFGTSNYIRASVCALTKQQPAETCSQSGVKAAAHAMGIG
jgi:Domain of unknown function (DUF929)